MSGWTPGGLQMDSRLSDAYIMMCIWYLDSTDSRWFTQTQSGVHLESIWNGIINWLYHHQKKKYLDSRWTRVNHPDSTGVQLNYVGECKVLSGNAPWRLLDPDTEEFTWGTILNHWTYIRKQSPPGICPCQVGTIQKMGRRIWPKDFKCMLKGSSERYDL